MVNKMASAVLLPAKKKKNNWPSTSNIKTVAILNVSIQTRLDLIQVLEIRIDTYSVKTDTLTYVTTPI
jgi:hypothetical protein